MDSSSAAISPRLRYVVVYVRRFGSNEETPEPHPSGLGAQPRSSIAEPPCGLQTAPTSASITLPEADSAVRSKIRCRADLMIVEL